MAETKPVAKPRTRNQTFLNLREVLRRSFPDTKRISVTDPCLIRCIFLKFFVIFKIAYREISLYPAPQYRKIWYIEGDS